MVSDFALQCEEQLFDPQSFVNVMICVDLAVCNMALEKLDKPLD